MKFKNWLWGTFLLGSGSLIIVNELGYLSGINVYTLIFTILLTAGIIQSFISRSMSLFAYSVAFLIILYKTELGVSNLSILTVLLATTLLIIGFGVLFGSKIYKKHIIHTSFDYDEENFEHVINEKDKDVIEFKVSLSSAVKYINSDNFKKAILGCSLGALKVYFDGADIKKGETALIRLDASLSGVELYIPKNWKLINNLNNTLSGVEEKGIRERNDDSPEVILNGNINLSGIEIFYV